MDSSADKITALYERHARHYVADRRQVEWHESGWLDRFSALLSPGASILDIGCGCGEPIAKYLLGRGFTVDGVDSAPTLIAICRERFPQRSWHQADMRTLALDRSFDGLLAWDSFFHLARDAQRAMFPVFARHAAPGTALMFTSGTSDGEAIGTYRGEALYHASLAPQEYRALLKAHGFHVVAHVVEDPNCGGHTVWLAQRTTTA